MKFLSQPQIGVYVCHCGTNIAGVENVKTVAEYASTLPNVVVAKDHTYLCSDPGQDMIKKDIKEMNLNRVIVASCSPRMHEPTFQGTLKEAEWNPYFLEMANIREQCSWPHAGDPAKATEKSKDLVRKRVAKVMAAKCKGCGACAATCPSSGIRVNHFVDRQVLAMIRGAFS